MKSIEVTGKTVEEAISKGLVELEKKKDEVEYKIIDIPNKGFLGIIGSKLAKIKMTVKDTPAKDAEIFLKETLNAMGLEVMIDAYLDGDVVKVYLEGPNMGVVIGRRGQTLDSLQYLTSLVINKGRDKYLKVFIDTENYRQKREDTLVNLAHKMVEKVKRTKRSVALEPMNPYERRIIHAALQSSKAVQTYSEGEEPHRKVVIALKRKPS
ncbi:RNA-binding cell elongation regulator Jag/EloR [Serpentinicella sp. ANB-PHB4]|uniref:RNA-binding cell elongation regulator Jag/EloR n=1 Tax=Serpentinicella sp. ANB-PHB4 TaxID=3074076 RepID=UPI0028621721|nr:RNA-binding cell elongation regulator Jag/EloR [Serpentinicella sp. ANB-PHB4]MDR5658907.1 RNA-binding cell elongation regulator Jag/EloR [Serpentinicella sp. ANB-PHB4]